jgi:hypothetical protein
MKNIINSPLLVLTLSLVALWLSTRIGVSFRKQRRSPEEDEHEDFVLIVSATLTLLALIIGFSSSTAINRYDQRKKLRGVGGQRDRHGIRPGRLPACRRCGQSASVAENLPRSADFVLYHPQ